MSLDEVNVKGYAKSSGIKTIAVEGTTIWDMDIMNSLPKILGNADPIHYSQMLPGIQTNSEYDSGLHIEGCDNQHNTVSIGGVPMYNITHLLGFFSLFNASHYPTMSISKTAMNAADGNVLGGTMNMDLPDSITQGTSGEFSVGLISAQGTIRQSVGKHSMVLLSARTSFINLLYSHWLKQNDTTLKYGFTDANLTYIYQPSERNTFWFDSYYGYDHSKIDATAAAMFIHANWGNQMLAGHWLHKSRKGNELKQSLYMTRTYNDLGMAMSILDFKMPSSLTDIGYKLRWDAGRFTAGIEIVHHHSQPQSPETEGDSSYSIVDNSQPFTNALENTAYIGYTQPVTDNISIVGGLRGSIYIRNTKNILRGTYDCLDPSLSVRYSKDKLQLSANYAIRHQFLHQTGMSSMNLPTEFWALPVGDIKPQYANSYTFIADYNLNKKWNFSAEVFYKNLHNQIEYYGQPLNMVNSIYRLDDNIVHGKGYNYGFSVMVNKRTGRLCGWMSYTYSRARRQFEEDGFTGWYSSSHERPHELDIVATYELTPRISLGATGVVASGNPFTNPESIYFYNGSVMVEYGEHNASRLDPYIRLDLSLNYKLKTKCFKESGLNFSIYNSQIRNNEIGRFIKVFNDKISFKSFRFMLPLMPSVSYYAKF